MKAADIVLLTIGDGRDGYHDRSLESARAALEPEIDDGPIPRVIVDDSDHRLGFAGAIAEGWEAIRRDHPQARWVFHLELDFTFSAPVPLDRMAGVLERNRYLVQLALKRQAWNRAEKAAGGIVELFPDSYIQRTDLGDVWTEHRRFFTTNPSLYSAGLARQPWPQEAESEGKFTHRLLESAEARFAFWGAKFDEPLVTHIGDERQGTGY